MVDFSYPFVLLFYFFVLIGILYNFLKNEKKQTFSSTNTKVKKNLFKRIDIKRIKLKDRLVFFSLVFMIFAASGPKIGTRIAPIERTGIDLVFAIDVSSSMLAQDLKPDRLTALKRVAAEFIEDRRSDRIGLVVYAGESYTKTPITSDKNIVKSSMREINFQGIIEDGTAIGMGLATSVNRLKDSKAKSKIIILLTDGVNNSGFIDPKIATELAVEFGIKTYTIGLGSNGTALAPVGILPNGKFKYGLTKVEIDEALLKEIALKTGGIYFRATNNQKLEEIYQEINKLEKTEIEEFKYYNYEEKYRILILLAIGFIIFEWIFKNTLFKSFI